MTSMPTITAATGAAAAPLPGLTASERLSFIAYDLAATHRFYTEVLGLPLVYAERRERVAGDDTRAPHIEVRYGLADGSTLSFTVFRGAPPEPCRRLHPLRHFAFGVQDAAAVRRWHAHLVAHGVEVVGPVDHEVVLSIYFHDPNEIRLELTTDLIAFDDAEARKAEQILADWWRLGATEQHTPVGGHSRAEGAGAP